MGTGLGKWKKMELVGTNLGKWERDWENGKVNGNRRYSR